MNLELLTFKRGSFLAEPTRQVAMETNAVRSPPSVEERGEVTGDQRELSPAN